MAKKGKGKKMRKGFKKCIISRMRATKFKTPKGASKAYRKAASSCRLAYKKNGKKGRKGRKGKKKGKSHMGKHRCLKWSKKAKRGKKRCLKRAKR